MGKFRIILGALALTGVSVAVPAAVDVAHATATNCSSYKATAFNGWAGVCSNGDGQYYVWVTCRKTSTGAATNRYGGQVGVGSTARSYCNSGEVAISGGIVPL